MNHTRTIRLPGVTVWSECVKSPKERYYAQVQQPTTLPMVTSSPNDSQPKIGISTIAFNNPDGNLIATQNDSMPTTVWIWSLKLLRPYAILVQQNPIKSISWHPTIPDLLMIQCTPDSGPGEPSAKSQGVVYLWSAAWSQPRAVTVPMDRLSGSTWARWILTAPPTGNTATTSSTASTSPQPWGHSGLDRRSRSPEKDADKKPMLMFGDKDGYTVGWVDDEPVPEEEEHGDPEINDRYGFPLAGKRSWDPVDWEYYSPNNVPPRRALSSASQVTKSYIQQENRGSSSRGGLGSVSGETSSGCAQSNGKEGEDSFEYKPRGQNVRVRS